MVDSDLMRNSLEEFVWSRHKRQVTMVCGSLTLFLLGRVVVATSVDVVLPWLLCVLLATLLFVLVTTDYHASRPLCNALSPLLVSMIFLAWYAPQFSKQRPCDVVAGLVLACTTPLILCVAPLMSWKAGCIVSGAIASFLLVLQPPRCSEAFLAWPGYFIFIAVLSYHSWASEKHLFFREKVIACLKLDKEQLDREFEGYKHSSSEKVAKMRQFISYIFHEIRVPFNAVVLGIGHLLATNVTEEQQEVLKMMDSSSSSMIRILNDVLDMGKIESGKLQLEKQPFNLGELVSSLIWAFKDTLESKGLEFSLCVDSCTKEFLSGHDLIGDKHRIRQVLANYLSNATKFTPRGGKVILRVVWTRNVSGDCKPEDELKACEVARKLASVTVSVEDTGIGICKEDQARLFEPYMQIHTGSSHSNGGTGLGLSFAKRIVELAGGQIGVFSEVGKGSVFSFTVPFEVCPEVKTQEVFTNPFEMTDQTSAVTSFSNLPKVWPTGTNPKVLIVEDNQTNRKILRKLLASFKVESDDVEDGRQAVELCRKGCKYDMIFIDKEMPVMDGHEATREIRAMGIKTTIVGLTGNALDSDRNQFLAAGVNDFFTKPLSRHQLLKLLQNHGLVGKTS